MRFDKGHEFIGPNGQGYRLTCDVVSGDTIMAAQFEAFGGAPEPTPHEMLPLWLAEQIEAQVAYQMLQGNAVLARASQRYNGH